MTKGQMAMMEVDRLLAAARPTMAETIDCWVMTPSDGVHARAVEPIAAAPDDEDWTISFIASARSRKAAEIERARCLTLGYQHANRSYGRATRLVERAAIRARWREPWRVPFPSGPEDPNLIIVRLAVDRIELCVRGVTPEPFGTHGAILERGPGQRWRLVQG